jgi:ribosomal protein L11 methyltransferase PrmA/PRMT5 arginine-N-methyltransferase
VYSLEDYGKMVSDKIRMDAYLGALQRAVTPGSIVVDLGCGPGVFAMHACRLGAKRVYAIEPDEAIQIAQDLADANGLGSQIECIQSVSTQVTLPEQADVIIADLRGILPLWGNSLPSMIDARERFLKPGGVLIPKRDTLWATVIEAPATYGRSTLPWETALRGFDTSVIREMTTNSVYKIRTHPNEYLGEPCEIESIDYGTVTSSSHTSDSRWQVSRSGIAHGIALWFETELAEGIGLSNAPGQPELLYGQAFFPFREPLPVTGGDRVTLQIRADLVRGDYVWRWNTALNGTHKFEQSTFFGMPVACNSLRPSDQS